MEGNVTVAVPFRHSGCRYRFESFRFISDMITGWIPDAEFVMVDAGGETFDRSRTRNLAVRRAENDVVVLHDADTFATKDNLLAAIEAARTHNGLVLPYHYYGGLSEESSARVMSDPKKYPPHKERYEETNEESIGGIWVIRKEAWWRAGGMDERFRGWGYEDNAFFVASETMNGPVKRIRGRIHHLHHPRPKGFTQTPEYFFNQRLYQYYREALGNPIRMQQILNEPGRHR